MNIILHWLDRIRDKTCKRYNICHVYLTKIGVKNYNIGMFIPLAKPLNQTIFSIKSSELFLGIDYLEDNYSLLGCNIADSPHYYLMEAIRKGDDITQTDYYKRTAKGTLDVRRGYFKGKHLDYYKLKYTERMKEIKNNTIAPVLVYKVNGKYYIYDGKHRAALCSLLDIPIKCQLVSNDRFDIRYKLISKNDHYLKHRTLYNSILAHGND